MIKYDNIFFQYLILILPLTLITGSAIPDISISITGIYFLIFSLYKKKFKNFFTNNLVYISLFFWLFLISISALAENKYLSYRDSIIFVRILIIPIFFILLDTYG